MKMKHSNLIENPYKVQKPVKGNPYKTYKSVIAHPYKLPRPIGIEDQATPKQSETTNIVSKSESKDNQHATESLFEEKEVNRKPQEKEINRKPAANTNTGVVRKQVVNPYLKKNTKIDDPASPRNELFKIQFLPDSPEEQPRRNRTKLHDQVIAFTRVANTVYGSFDLQTEALCPSCILTDSPTSNWLITQKCVHKYGSNPRCRDSCYGCGVHLSGCSGFGNERYCQAALYDGSCAILETRSESIRRGIPMICKSCLCPLDSHNRCVSLCKCFMSDNKYFVWCFCHLARRALLFDKYKPKCIGDDSVPRDTQLKIKKATQQMWKDLYVPLCKTTIMGPFDHIDEAEEWSIWLLTISFGAYYNYMPFE